MMEPTVAASLVDDNDNDGGGKPSAETNVLATDAEAHGPTDEEYVVENIINITKTMAQFNRDRDPNIQGPTTKIQFIEGEDDASTDGDNVPILLVADDVAIINVNRENAGDSATSNYNSDKDDNSILVATLRDELHTLEDKQLDRMGIAVPKESPPMDGTQSLAAAEKGGGRKPLPQTTFSGQKRKAIQQCTLKTMANSAVAAQSAPKRKRNEAVSTSQRSTTRSTPRTPQRTTKEKTKSSRGDMRQLRSARTSPRLASKKSGATSTAKTSGDKWEEEGDEETDSK